MEHGAPIVDAYLADPFVLRTEDGWYLYGTNPLKGEALLPVYRSPDLESWTFLRSAVERGAGGAWNRFYFWAPEVLSRDGRYWLYYTASAGKHPEHVGNRVGLAVSDTPEGPFEDVGVVVDHASLDGSPFVDDDGSMYLYFVSENGNARGLPAGRIYVDGLPSPERVAGEPVELVGSHPWQEGPCVLKRCGRYYLFYSIGSWGKADYRVVWAVSDSPLGPFEESHGIFLESSGAVRGTGHNNFFRGPDGGEWTVYHGWDEAFTARYPRIARVVWHNEQPAASGIDRPCGSGGGCLQ